MRAHLFLALSIVFCRNFYLHVRLHDCVSCLSLLAEPRSTVLYWKKPGQLRSQRFILYLALGAAHERRFGTLWYVLE